MRWGAVAAAGVGVLAAAPPARACSHVYGALGEVLVIAPTDHAQGVPLNVVVVLQYKDTPEISILDAGLNQGFELRKANGMTVEAAVSIGERWGVSYGRTRTLRIRPAAPLEPDTIYAVIGPPNAQTPPEELAVFTTGTVKDTTAPPMPDASVQLDPTFDCRFGASPTDLVCCADFQNLVQRGRIFASAGLTYTVHEGAKLVADDLPQPLPVLVECGPYGNDYELPEGQPMPVFLGPGPHTLTLVAHDLAGNESPPLALLVTPTCALLADAGVTTPDARLVDVPDARPAGSTRSGGCGVAGGGGPAAPVLALLARARRKRNAPASRPGRP